MSILDTIFSHKRKELSGKKSLIPEVELERRLDEIAPPLDFIHALQDPLSPPPRLIAEVKHRSPSKGILCADFDPVSLAETYTANGAAGISVLTDEKFFGGDLSHIRAIADLHLGVPLLRKDFIFDRYQLLESRISGTSAVLLIAAMLSQTELKALIDFAFSLELTPLVEVHSAPEIYQALGAGAPLIGINNRNLHNFEVDLQTTIRLRPLIPPNIPVVSESGIHTKGEIDRLAQANIDAILVGEAIVKSNNISKTVRRFSRRFQEGQSTERRIRL